MFFRYYVDFSAEKIELKVHVYQKEYLIRITETIN